MPRLNTDQQMTLKIKEDIQTSGQNQKKLKVKTRLVQINTETENGNH